jgi:hypothetical protein
MSKRDYRKFLIAKEKHKAELTEKVKVSQERVWNGDVDKYNESRLRGAIVQDLHNICNSSRLSTTCLEQLFRQIPGANWQQERPVCTIEKNEEKLRFTVKDPKNGTYVYDFISWQREAFLYTCKFAYTKGFELTAQQHLK